MRRAATEDMARGFSKQEAHNAKHGIVPTNASEGSPSATLSLFEVMAEEIAAERDPAAATAAARAEANPNVSAVSGEEGGTGSRRRRRRRCRRHFARGVWSARAWRTRARRRRRRRRRRETPPRRTPTTSARCGVAAADVSPSGVSAAALFANPRARRADDDSFTPTPTPREGTTTTLSTRPRHPRHPRHPAEAPRLRPLAIRQSARSRPRGWRTSTSATFAAPSQTCPRRRGVYRWLAADGSVLYVGKAKNLRARARGYLAPGLIRASPRHLRLAARARFVDAVLTPGGEADALGARSEAHRRFKPPMNVLLKHTPMVAAAMIVATLGDDVPRFFAVDAADASGGNAIGAGGNGAETPSGATARGVACVPAWSLTIPSPPPPRSPLLRRHARGFGPIAATRAAMSQPGTRVASPFARVPRAIRRRGRRATTPRRREHSRRRARRRRRRRGCHRRRRTRRRVRRRRRGADGAAAPGRRRGALRARRRSRRRGGRPRERGVRVEGRGRRRG